MALSFFHIKFSKLSIWQVTKIAANLIENFSFYKKLTSVTQYNNIKVFAMFNQQPVQNKLYMHQWERWWKNPVVVVFLMCVCVCNNYYCHVADCQALVLVRAGLCIQRVHRWHPRGIRLERSLGDVRHLPISWSGEQIVLGVWLARKLLCIRNLFSPFIEITHRLILNDDRLYQMNDMEMQVIRDTRRLWRYLIGIRLDINSKILLIYFL